MLAKVRNNPVPNSNNILLFLNTVGKIAEEFNYKVICGEQSLSNQIEHIVIAATGHTNLLRYIKDKTLIVTPGNQVNSILIAIAIALSKNRVHSYGSGSGGLVLTGGFRPDPIIYFLLSDANIPVLVSENDIFTVGARIRSLTSNISADNTDKIKVPI